MKPNQQAVLARDIIDMIEDYQDDHKVLQYLEPFTFALARGLEDGSVVNWGDIAGVCDQRYYSLQAGNPVPLNSDLLDRCKESIVKHLYKG